MSIRDLYNKKSNKILPSTSLNNIGEEIESVDYEKELREDKNRFIPNVDYSDISNFVKFGSAEKYYYDAITLIYNTYPYDGSLYEKLNWHNNSSDIVNYVFENLYPRTNGYINLGYVYGNTVVAGSYTLTDNPEYIFFKGSPNPSSETKLKDKFDKANKLYVEDLNKTYNLYINGENGFTVEFWLNKESHSGSQTQVILDIWNSSSYSVVPGNPYGRFRIETRNTHNDAFYFEMKSGSVGQINVPIGQNLNLTGSGWNHYAFSVYNISSSWSIELYKNGELNSKNTYSGNISEIKGNYIATLGSLVAPVGVSTGQLGYGKFSGSLDEFRFWKTKRSHKEIKRFWFNQVGGGTNTDEANIDLGIYYKFNEGIYNSSSISEIDKKIIDYSGKTSNGYWTGYRLGSRNTGSAIVISGFSESEFKDPILYSSHPEVVSLLQEKIDEGKEYDLTNNGSMFNSFPKWMMDEDPNGLKNLTQLISEYFDDLYLKIKFLPDIHDTAYREGKPITFASKLLESHGFATSDLFVDATMLENLLSRNESKNFQDKISNIKNFIYQNIFNNLSYINRSKGTEKSIRNLIRCFGVDESLIKLNLYANNSTYTLKDRYIPVSVRKKYINFDNPDNHESTVYQHHDSDNLNSLSYIPGSSYQANNGSTLQAELYIPSKFELSEQFYDLNSFITSSIIGMHSANTSDQDDYTWYSSDTAGLSVFLVKDADYSTNAKFLLTSSYLGINLTSSYISEIYSDSRWNISVRFYHEKYPYSNRVSGSDIGNYIVHFTGKNVISDTIINSFDLTASVQQALAEQYFSSAKRIYVGAHRQNFTGSLLQKSDVRISSVRYWLSKLSDNILIEHARDPLNCGVESPYEQTILPQISSSYVPSLRTLALNWDFENVTGSDNGSGTGPSNTYDGKFIVNDLTSGSISNIAYGNVGQTTRYYFTGRGDFFPRNNSNVVKRDFIGALKRKLPESLNDSDMVNIAEFDDIVFTRDTEPVVHYFALEKSMYQVISDEMIKLFGSIVSLNNLIGEPINRYKREYRYLDKLKEQFFMEVENDIDLERYMEFYKWFDNSIGEMIEQLMPLSANYSSGLKTIIESHILERNKYWNKYPTLEMKKEPPIAGARGIVELKYNWRRGHAPIPSLENKNCLWWNLRAHASGSLNVDRKGIIDFKINELLNRKFTTSYDFTADIVTITNINTGRTDIIRPAVKFSSNSYLSIESNEIYEEKDCDDEE